MPDEKTGPDPDHAWKTLALVNDWIKHADSKVGATVAITAATAVGLYKLVDSAPKPGWVVVSASVTCGLLLLLTAVQALMALLPRVHMPRGRKSKRQPESYDNLLFYRHITRGYPAAQKGTYLHSFAELTMDPARLTKQIGEQVYANAAVAQRKYEWSNRAIVTLAIAVIFLAVAAFAAVWK